MKFKYKRKLNSSFLLFFNYFFLDLLKTNLILHGTIINQNSFGFLKFLIKVILIYSAQISLLLIVYLRISIKIKYSIKNNCIFLRLWVWRKFFRRNFLNFLVRVRIFCVLSEINTSDDVFSFKNNVFSDFLLFSFFFAQFFAKKSFVYALNGV